MKLDSVELEISIPGIQLGGTWTFDETERRAACEIYVELVTRIAVARLEPAEGSLREALSSFHSLFATSREILRKYGPDVAQPKKNSDYSLGYLVLWMLNAVVRPLLAKWHPLLLDYEKLRPDNLSSIEHEKNWSEGGRFRAEIDAATTALTQYALVLEQVCGIPSLIPKQSRR